jgi:hypothetical protein
MMAKKNGVMLMGGMSMGGRQVTMKGELTGADCYLTTGDHGHEHALCAKACVSHGGPIVFFREQWNNLSGPSAERRGALSGPGLERLGQAGRYRACT